MQTVCEKNKCCGCGACVAACPQQCIAIRDDILAYNAVIDTAACIHCDLCKKLCPNVSTIKLYEPISWHQGWAEESIRRMGSSGGAATSIIRSIIISGGYVTACLFREGAFVFDITNDIEKAEEFAGSKYVKSNPVDIYEKVARRLRTDKVLFIGLPCQVAAMKNYVRENDRLYTIDLICHGTPSPKLLSGFLKEHGYDINTLENIQFRAKNNFGVIVDGEKLSPGRVIDDYLCAFLSSLSYTENCYSCQFARPQRIADITIGDSWGTEYQEEKDKGISLAIVQTPKGQEMMDNAVMTWKNVDLSNAIRNNQQLSHPSILPRQREKFMKMIKDGRSFKTAVFRAIPQMIARQKMKRILTRPLPFNHSGGK